MVQWEFAGTPNQIFRKSGAGDGFYKLYANHSNKVLTVKSFSQEDGANIVQESYWEEDYQRFKFVDQGNGYYSIIAKHSGKAISVHGESQEDGANINQWHFVEGQDNQLFAFFEA